MAKGSKHLNPADKARKEARRKELKKNKKQRQQVRSAAIESRNPEQILADLEKLDKLEFDLATNNSQSSDTFFKDKRKRLKDLLQKVLAYYQKEDPDKYTGLKKLEADYEIKHKRCEKSFEAIKAASEVAISDVFLPPEPNSSSLDDIVDDDALMSESVYITPLTDSVKPPGCPPGLPPDFKQLVDSLKDSLAVPLAPQQNYSDLSQLPPPRSMNRPNRLSRNSDKRNADKRNIEARPKLSSSLKAPRAPQVKIGQDKGGKANPPTNAAVIESKPIIFMQKATKFVPASVRSKIAKTTQQK